MSNERLRFTREGAQVTRAHTNVHDGKYTVGLHSYNATNLVLLYHPNPSLNLIKAVMWHDLAERHVGDVPSPILRQMPEFQAFYQKAEAAVFKYYDLELPKLTPDELCWYYAVDKLELLLWAREQLYAGNNRFDEYVKVLYAWGFENKALVPDELKPLFQGFDSTRNKDMINNLKEFL